MVNELTFPGLGLSFQLDKVAFRLPAWLGSLEIYWYGIIIAVAFFVAITYMLGRTKTFGLDADRVFDVAFVTIILGIVGARLYYVIFDDPGYVQSFADIFRTRDGGLAIYGGIILGIVGILIATKARDVKLLPMMDLTVGGVLLGQAIGRWGNFINIEAFGTNTTLPWGMKSPVISSYLATNQAKLASLGMNVNPLEAVHPTFLYESLWCLVGFVIIVVFTKRRRFDGQLTLFYLAWYGIGRFFIEGLRTDSLLLGEVRISKAVAAVSAIGAILVMVYLLYKAKKSADPDFLKLYVNGDEAALILAGEYYTNKKKDAEDTEDVDPKEKATEESEIADSEDKDTEVAEEIDIKEEVTAMAGEIDFEEEIAEMLTESETAEVAEEEIVKVDDSIEEKTEEPAKEDGDTEKK